MYELKTTSGVSLWVNRRRLESLRMLMDWQVRERGIDPDSVTAACRAADARDDCLRVVCSAAGIIPPNVLDPGRPGA